MKYFVELLESYSKLKKRKLTLLSEADQPQAGQQGSAKQKAEQAIRNAGGPNVPALGGDPEKEKSLPALNKPYVVPGTNIGIFFARTKNIRQWKAGYVQADGAVGGRQFFVMEGGKLSPDYIKLFSSDDKAEGGQDVEEGEVDPSNMQALPSVDPNVGLPIPQIQIDSGPGSKIAEFFNQSLLEPKPDPMANDAIFQMGQQASQNIVEAAQLSIGALKYFQSLKGAASKFIQSEGPAKTANYLFGGSHQSLESKITKVSYKMVNVRDGLYDIKDTGKIAPEDLLAYSEVMKEFFEIFKPDGTEIKQKINNKLAFLKNRFTLNSDDTVTIYLDDAKTKSLVFKEKNIIGSSRKGLLRFMLEALENDLGNQKLPKVNILKKASAGFNNAVRGVLLEKITIYNTILQRAASAQTSEERSKWEGLVKKHLESDKKFKENLRKLKDLNEEWTMAGEMAALPEQDHYFNTALTEFFGEEVSMLFKAAHVIASDVQRKKPFTMLHVGTETGPGLKADAIEVYLENPPEGASLEVAAKVPQLKDYISAGLVLPNQNVFLRRPDYKHYLDYGENTQFNAGGSSRNSIFELVKGIAKVDGGGVQSAIMRRKGYITPTQDRSKLIKYNNSNLINKSQSLPELKQFVSDIEESIKNLLKVDSKNIDPKTGETVDRAQQIATSFIDTLRKTFTHADQNKTNLINNINRYAKEYLEAKKNNKQEKFEKFMGGLQSAMTSLHINKSLNGSNPTVGKNMLLSIINSAAGSVQKGGCSINRVMGSQSSRQYEFERNAPLNLMQKAIKEADKNQIEFNGSDFHIKDKDGSFLGSISFDPSKDKYFLYYDEKFIQNKLGIQPTVVQYRTKQNQGVEVAEESTLLNVFIQNQMKLLETLMSLQKKSVVK